MVRRKNTRRRGQKPRQQPRTRKMPSSVKRRAPLRSHPFIECTLGPVDQPSMGLGVPDGSDIKTIVVDHRQTYVIEPVDGQVAFALMQSPTGAFAIQTGKFTATMNIYSDEFHETWGTPSSRTFINSPAFAPPDAGGSAVNFGVLPFQESLLPNGTNVWVNQTGLKVQSFRAITTQAKVDYTGATLSDSGTATTARMKFNTFEEYPASGLAGAPHLPFQSYGPLPRLPPASFSDCAQLPGAEIFPVRQSRELINVPHSYDWQDMRVSWAPAYTAKEEGGPLKSVWIMAQYAGEVDPESGGYAPMAGLGHADTTFYFAQGMAEHQTITVQVRCCIEYSLGFDSPAIRMATMPPPENLQAISAVKAVARCLPSSQPSTPQTEQSGWLHNALSWYGNTMKTIVGKSWQLGGRIAGMVQPEVGSLIYGAGRALSGEQPLERPVVTGRIPLGIGY